MPADPPLDPPPRHVPASLRLRVLLGGVPTTIGWCLLAFGGFLATVFVGNSELATSLRFAAEFAAVEGEVVACEPTNMRHDDRQVHRVTFSYLADGERREGSAYTTSLRDLPEVGARLPVEYAIGDPETARVPGLQTAPFPAWTAFVLVFPLVGAVLLAVGIRGARRRLHLLRNGRAAWGILTDRQPTSTRINGARVYLLTFRFVDAAGAERTVRERSHLAEHFDASVARPVLHDPDAGIGCLVDAIPGRPRFVEGRWQPIGMARLAAVIVLPIVTVVALYGARYVVV